MPLLPRAFADAALFDVALEFLDPFERVTVQRVSTHLNSISRKHRCAYVIDNLSVLFAGDVWQFGEGNDNELPCEFSELLADCELQAKRINQHQSTVAWGCLGNGGDSIRKRTIRFDAQVRMPNLLSLGRPRNVTIHGASGVAAMRTLLRRPSPCLHDSTNHVALKICHWRLERGDSMEEVRLALSNVVQCTRTLLWWNPDIVLEAACYVMGDMKNLRSLTMVLHGAEFSDSLQLNCLAMLKHLPNLTDMTVLSAQRLAPQYPNPCHARLFSFTDPHDLRHLAIGLCGMTQLEELSFPEFHKYMVHDDLTLMAGAMFIADLITYLPSLTHLGVIPCSAAYWSKVRTHAISRKHDLPRQFAHRPAIHIEVVGNFSYAADLKELVDCFVIGFPGLSLHLDLRLDVLLLENGEDDFIFETDLDVESLARILCELRRSMAATVDISLETNLPDLDHALLDSLLFKHNINLKNCTQIP